MECKIKTEYPPSHRELQGEITLLLRHEPPTQPTPMTYISRKGVKSIKPICQAKTKYYHKTVTI